MPLDQDDEDRGEVLEKRFILSIEITRGLDERTLSEVAVLQNFQVKKESRHLPLGRDARFGLKDRGTSRNDDLLSDQVVATSRDLGRFGVALVNLTSELLA